MCGSVCCTALSQTGKSAFLASRASSLLPNVHPLVSVNTSHLCSSSHQRRFVSSQWPIYAVYGPFCLPQRESQAPCSILGHASNLSSLKAEGITQAITAPIKDRKLTIPLPNQILHSPRLNSNTTPPFPASQPRFHPARPLRHARIRFRTPFDLNTINTGPRRDTQHVQSESPDT